MVKAYIISMIVIHFLSSWMQIYTLIKSDSKENRKHAAISLVACLPFIVFGVFALAAVK